MSPSRALFLSLGALGVLGYLGLVFLVSVTSLERTLPAGAPLRFCGLYLDCHLSASVEEARTTPLPGGGVRYTVTVRFASDARRATLTLDRPDARLVDDRGISIGSMAGPRAMVLAPDTSVSADYVFDAPGPLENPRLLVRKGGFLERLTELFLVGDPDSFLHQPVTLALR
jgi:hypothetical protein